MTRLRPDWPLGTPRTHEDGALDDIPVPAVLVSRDGEEVACNPAWTDLVELRTSANGEQSWLDAIHQASRDDALAAIADAVHRSDVVSGEWRLAAADGEPIRYAAARMRRSQDGHVLVALWEASAPRREAAIRTRATHDALTGLLNREVLADCTRKALERLEQQPAQLALLIVDLDDFETVNERVGRLIGDRVLVAAAVALASAIRPTDSIARISGARFGVLCEAMDDDEAAEMAERLRMAVSKPIDFGDLSLEVAASVVIARTGDCTDSFDALLERADRAMHFSTRTRTIAGRVAASKETPPASGVRVLIVDDRHMVAEALMLSLQQHGFGHVALAPNVSYDGVVSAANDFAPDIALIDSEMAENTTSVCSLIRILSETGTVVVMLTGADDPERSAACLEAGAAGIFDKSRRLDDLIVFLSDAAMGRTVLQPASREALLEVVRSQRQEARRRMAPFQSLTIREQAVLAGMMEGKNAEVIAKEHNVSLATIRTQIRAVLQKLGVNSQLAAVALAARAGWEPAA